MRVSKNSKVPQVAGALAGSLRSLDTTNLDVMGTGAVYNAVKAILLAQEFIKENKLAINLTVAKIDTTVGEGLERTAIRFTVHPRMVGGAYDNQE